MPFQGRLLPVGSCRLHSEFRTLLHATAISAVRHQASAHDCMKCNIGTEESTPCKVLRPDLDSYRSSNTSKADIAPPRCLPSQRSQYSKPWNDSDHARFCCTCLTTTRQALRTQQKYPQTRTSSWLHPKQPRQHAVAAPTVEMRLDDGAVNAPAEKAKNCGWKARAHVAKSLLCQALCILLPASSCFPSHRLRQKDPVPHHPFQKQAKNDPLPITAGRYSATSTYCDRPPTFSKPREEREPKTGTKNIPLSLKPFPTESWWTQNPA
jgi:hypothetical protein